MSEHAVVQPSLDGTILTWPEAPEGGWDRVLLKLSGEAFAGEGDLGVDPDVVQSIARQIAGIVRSGQLLQGRPTLPTGYGSRSC